MSLEEVLTAKGINEEFVKAFCDGLGPDQRDVVEDFNKSTKLWLATINDEMKIFAMVGTFTSDERFSEYMKKEKFPIYVFYHQMIKHLYGKNYDQLIADARNKFRQQVSKNMQLWAWDLFWWDNLWAQDPTIGKLILSEIEKRTSKAREKAPKYLPVIKPTVDEYQKKVMYPFLGGLTNQYKEDGKLLGDIIWALEITGYKRNSIETTLLRGHGAGYGLLKMAFKKTAKPNSKLMHAYHKRIQAACELSLNETIRTAKNSPEAKVKISNALRQLNRLK